MGYWAKNTSCGKTYFFSNELASFNHCTEKLKQNILLTRELGRKTLNVAAVLE
jgi:hypothetical protein